MLIKAGHEKLNIEVQYQKFNHFLVNIYSSLTIFLVLFSTISNKVNYNFIFIEIANNLRKIKYTYSIIDYIKLFNIDG